ncbi:MAG: GTP-binding protein [Eubacterium sp.]
MKNDLAQKKLVLLTGFLGSGKTTFLTRLLSAFDGVKIGVLMNEFGEKSIDGTLIRGTDFDLMELTNGSIFCACLKENFIKGLAEFLERDVEYVFVESSGVADPSNMGSVLETVEKLTDKTYDYLGAVCIIDGFYFLKQYEVIPALHRQIEYSNAVIINKIDLQSPENSAEIEDRIKKINADTLIYKTAFCQVPIKEILHTMNYSHKTPKETTNTWESRPKTNILTTETIIDKIRFERFLNTIKGDTYRIKGFVRTDTGDFAVSGVNETIEMEPWTPAPKKTEIVIISSVGIKIISTVLNAWKCFFNEIPMIFE